MLYNFKIHNIFVADLQQYTRNTDSGNFHHQATLKTLIYGGNENQKRTAYNIVSWQSIDNEL